MNTQGSSLLSPQPQPPQINLAINVPINKRELFAMYALNGLLADAVPINGEYAIEIARAVEIADKLIEALKQ